MTISLEQYLADSKIRDEIYAEQLKVAGSEIENRRGQIDDLLDNGVGRIIPTQKGYHDFN